MVPDKSAAITNEALAQKLNVIRNTVQLWFKKDDITISATSTRSPKATGGKSTSRSS